MNKGKTMKFRAKHIKSFFAATGVSIILASCASAPTVSDGALAARADLNRLQSNNELASLARVEIREAEEAVAAAERPTSDEQLSDHLIEMAESKIEIARSWAQSRLYEQQREALNAEAENVRLEARSMEAERARIDARSARNEAEIAQAAAVVALSEAEEARTDATAARTEMGELQQQIAELNARTTDRGLVMTLGDIMFETGNYELRSGTTSNLDKLVEFLSRYEDRSVEIEGHTDSTGSDESNLILSRNRADSVADYLVSQGIDRSRISTIGKGEDMPVANNDSITGRQQNRRVEVIISNETEVSQF